MFKTDPTEMSLSRLFFRTEHLIHRYMASRMQDAFDPERGQGRILALLKKTGPLSQKDIAYLLGLRPQSLGELLRKLEEGGFITREPLADDKRGRLVSLTEKGQDVEMPRSPVEDVFACLDETEQETLHEYLERICSSIRDALPEDEPWPHPPFGMPGPGGGCGHGPGGPAGGPGAGPGHRWHHHCHGGRGAMGGWFSFPGFFGPGC